MKREITDDDEDLPLIKLVVVGSYIFKIRVEWSWKI
jgi:hypothetical protein